MNYSAIKAELALPSYAGMTDQQAADALNAQNIAIKVDVPSSVVRGTLYATGAWRKIVSLSLDGKSGDAVHDAALVAAKQLIEFCATDDPFGTSAPAILSEVTTDLAALVTATTITPDDQTAVLALTDSKISRADQLNLGEPVLAEHVAKARAL